MLRGTWSRRRDICRFGLRTIVTAPILLVVAMGSQPLTGEVIQPTGVTATSTFTDPVSGDPVSPPILLIDGSGLDGNGPVQNQGHDLSDVTELNSWLSNGGTVADEELVFDLGAIYDLTSALVWQGNNPGTLSRGVDDFDILVSNDPPSADNFTLLGSRNLQIGGGIPGEPAQNVAASAEDVRAVKFDIKSVQSGDLAEFVNLSEVRFDGTFVREATLGLTIDRDDGSAIIANNTTLSQVITNYSITSPSTQALNAAQWLSIADNYDQDANAGGEVVDPDDVWTVTSAMDDELSEGTTGDATLIDTQQINLSDSGLWVRHPDEDVIFTYELQDGTVESVKADFINGFGDPYLFADLDFDNDVDLDDFQDVLVPNLFGPELSVSVRAQSYASGDLDNDQRVGLSDFLLFEEAYRSHNPLGPPLTFFSTPEPASWMLAAIAGCCLGLMAARRRSRRACGDRARRACVLLLPAVPAVALALGGAVTTARSEVITPSNVIGTSQFGLGIEVESLIDGSGLDGIGPIEDQLHGNDGNTMWFAGDVDAGIPGGTDNDGEAFTPPPVAEQILEFALPRIYSLNSSLVWQYNELNPFGGGTSFTFRGVKDFEVQVSSTTNGPFMSVGNYSLLEAADAFTPEPAQLVALDDNGTGALGAVRRVRFNIQSAHSGEVIEYVGLSEVRFEGEIAGDKAMKLLVDTSRGITRLINGMVIDQDVNGYSVSSESAALDVSPDGWNSLDDQNFDVSGPGPGESWTEGGASNAESLGEVFLLASSLFDPGRTVELGRMWNPASGAEGQDLEFFYTLTDGQLIEGDVQYIRFGDMDCDGDVDFDDINPFVLGLSNPDDYEMQFGVPATQKGDTDFDSDLDFDDIAGFVDILTGAQVAAHGVRAIPEPAAVWLMTAGVMVLGAVRIGRAKRAPCPLWREIPPDSRF